MNLFHFSQTSSTEKAQRQAVASDKTPGNNRQSTTEKTLPLITPDAVGSFLIPQYPFLVPQYPFLHC